MQTSESNKQRNARRNLDKKHADDKQWRDSHPPRIRDNVSYSAELNERRNPLDVDCDNALITSDFHLPFVDWWLFQEMIKSAKDNDIKTLFISGDMWDCDNYTKFTRLTPMEAFEEEVESVRFHLKILMQEFKDIYICRGNHEKRWIDMNAGRMGMKELFKLAIPGNYSEDYFNEHVHITMDDHIRLTQSDNCWLLCHPKNFRIINLSVVRDLAAKYHCNVIGAHGHQMCQGWDKSGWYRICDGGGLFDKNALEYLRDTNCYPETRSGFYTLIDNRIMPYEGK
jgi:hypothetical protein